MCDGIRLSATVYQPVGAGRCPGILIANGYGEEGERLLADTTSRLACRGYVVVCAHMRGLPPSEGNVGLYDHFGVDTHALIEWLAPQPECNGRVGMFGGSLLGLVQYLGAREAPAGLEAILPDDAGSDNYWYLWHPGGMCPGPGRAARGSMRGAEKEYALAVAHPNYDAFWRERTVQAEDLEQIARRGVAVFLTSGWDSYLLGSTRSYEWLKVGSPGKRLKMFIGPWAHGTFMSPLPPLAGPAVLPYTGFEYGLMWLDRWLKGVLNGVDEEPPVLIYVQGPNEWRFESDWPLPDARWVRLYLRDLVSGTGAGLNDGTLGAQPPDGDRRVAYYYSPEGPYNPAAVTGYSRPRIDKSAYEAHGLAWTSEPLAVPTELTGHPRICFWCSLSVTDTDFVVEMADVGPDEGGVRLQSLQVTRGYLNAMRYFSRSDPQPLEPNRPYRFELDLYPTSYVFPVGHRIRITLQGSAIDPSTQTAMRLPESLGIDPAVLSVPHGPGLNRQAATVTVLQDIQHPTYVDLPIIGSSGLA